MSTSERICRRVVVTGRVQGVCFRASTLDRARALGLAGWVRNLPGGEVEALFEGPAAAVESALAFCREGPAHAVVARAEVAAEAATGRATFEIRY